MPPVYSKKHKRPSAHHPGTKRQGRNSPCEKECLAGNHIQQVHNFISGGDPTEALRWLHIRNPFPGITGRVCPHPCQNACNRASHDEKVGVRNLERYAADHGEPTKFKPLASTGAKLAIIGAGPAGLAAARFARLLGMEVDVYEKAPVMGGVPRQAIPEFRLPRDIVDRETANSTEGVRVYTNIDIGSELKIPDILGRYDACLLACGLGRERILDIPGRELLESAVAWLKNSTMARKSLAGKNVVILGGGGVAFDCAFTAKRLKAASVKMVFLESEDKLRVPVEEAEQAREEGIQFYPSMLAKSVAKNGSGLTVTAEPIKSFVFDKTGQLHVEVAGLPAIELEADLAICASGLLPDSDVLKDISVELTPAGHVITDENYATSVPGLYAAGEITTGPSLVATAIRNGREAAIAIYRRLHDMAENMAIILDENNALVLEKTGEPVSQHTVLPEEIMNIDYHERKPAARQPKKAVFPGVAFYELEDSLATDEAVAEAARCMHCGQCMECGSCVEACPGHILQMGEDGPQVAYPSQCWHCGCCRIACPTSSISYKFPLTMMV